MARSLLLLAPFLFCGCFVFADREYSFEDAEVAAAEVDETMPEVGDPCDAATPCSSGLVCENEVCCAGGGCCADEFDCGLYACNEETSSCFVSCQAGEDDDCAETAYCNEYRRCEDKRIAGNCGDDIECETDICISGRCCTLPGLCCSTNHCGDFFDECDLDTRTCPVRDITIPATGQTSCYGSQDAEPQVCEIMTILKGQDAERGLPASEFAVSESDTVVHQIADGPWVVWARDFSDSVIYDDAEEICPRGWRLPTRFELMTLVDYGSIAQWRLNDAFEQPSTAELEANGGSLFWSGTEAFSEAPGRHQWAVDFSSGRVLLNNRHTRARARCVTLEASE